MDRCVTTEENLPTLFQQITPEKTYNVSLGEVLHLQVKPFLNETIIGMYNKSHNLKLGLFHNDRQIPLNISDQGEPLGVEIFIQRPDQAGLYQWYILLDDDILIPIKVDAYLMEKTIFSYVEGMRRLPLPVE